MLELRNLTRRYGDVVALDGLTLEVRSGQMVGLLGPNGAGKSTAMRIALGLVRPDSGEVRWQDRLVDGVTRRRFGYLPEERGLYPRMRVRDQVVYFGRLHGLSRADAAGAADRWLERLGIVARSADRVDTLSLGNQQRVQLAAALVHEPDLLVLDEPFSGLDPVAVDALSEILAERAAAGTGVLFSSHQLDLVEDICESVAIVDKGHLVLSGVVRELRARSRRRQLRVLVEGDGWQPPDIDGVVVAGADVSGARLLLEPGVDPMAVLTAVAASGRVVDFGLELPSLSDLFREAIRS
ncbi:MAG: ABC transporter ATP-binding protein [Acidimicrobiales bacterium]